MKCGSGLVFILSNQQCGIRTLQPTRWINGEPLKVEKRVDILVNLLRLVLEKVFFNFYNI